MVSALGATTTFAVTDALGHYEIATLNPGPYLLRAHSQGYIAPRAQMVEIRSNVRLASSFAMRRADDRPQVLAAGIGAVPSSEPAPSEPEPSPPLRLGVSGRRHLSSKDADDHSETAWRLRHARRSVLKDRLSPADLFGDDGLDTSRGRRLPGPRGQLSGACRDQLFCRHGVFRPGQPPDDERV